MIKFIDLTDQIVKGEKRFAFFNDWNGVFFEFSSNYIWRNVSDFRKDFVEYVDVSDENPNVREPVYALKRFLAIIPESFLPGSNTGAPVITEGPEIRMSENGDVVPDFKFGKTVISLYGNPIGSEFPAHTEPINLSIENLNDKAPTSCIVKDYSFDTVHDKVSGHSERRVKITLCDGRVLETSQMFDNAFGTRLIVGPKYYAVDGRPVQFWNLKDDSTVEIIEAP